MRPRDDLRALAARLADAPAVLVEVVRTEGSVPREAGAWMAVCADGTTLGTIGGGRLEHGAQAAARAMLADADAAPAPADSRHALGPSLGQCCGGVVWLRHSLVGAADAPVLVRRLAPPMRPVALFGGGHVGHALVAALAPLPFALTWIDSREAVFPQPPPPDVACEHSDPVQGAVPSLAAGSLVLVMSFSHAQDLEIVAQCLRRDELPFLGLIGSQTKWATFRHRLAERGFGDDALARVTCPIGIAGIAGKEPAVVAASVAAQLLQVHGRLTQPT